MKNCNKIQFQTIHTPHIYVSYTINMTRQGTMRVSEFICVVSEQSSKYPFLIYIHLLNLHLSFGSNIPHVKYNMYLLICVVRAQTRIYAHIWSEEWGECIQFYLQQFSINHVLLIQCYTYTYIRYGNIVYSRYIASAIYGSTPANTRHRIYSSKRNKNRMQIELVYVCVYFLPYKYVYMYCMYA